MKKQIFNSTLALIIIATLYSCGKVPPSVGARAVQEINKRAESWIDDEPKIKTATCGYCNGSGVVTDGYYNYRCNNCGGDGVVIISEN
ncbi:MAG: hypothetical protein UD103_01220 [Bacteroidales bacterium]|jgi:hypothetical protein|nr:hypothetical protein [Bacteroidales bacterium]